MKRGIRTLQWCVACHHLDGESLTMATSTDEVSNQVTEVVHFRCEPKMTALLTELPGSSNDIEIKLTTTLTCKGTAND